MDKQNALEQVKDAEIGTQAYPNFNTRWGKYYSENRPNGTVDYYFSEAEYESAHASNESSWEEFLPFDDDHIMRIWDDDSNILWEE